MVAVYYYICLMEMTVQLQGAHLSTLIIQTWRALNVSLLETIKKDNQEVYYMSSPLCC